MVKVGKPEKKSEETIWILDRYQEQQVMTDRYAFFYVTDPS
jgi:hypothetical protein